MAFTLFGVDPVAALQKLFGNQSADVMPDVNLGGFDAGAAVNKVLGDPTANVFPGQNYGGAFDAAAAVSKALGNTSADVFPNYSLAQAQANGGNGVIDSGQVAPAVDTGAGQTVDSGGNVLGSGGSSYVAPAPVVNQALVNAYLSQISALPETLQNLLTSNTSKYNSVMGGYKGEMTTATNNFNRATNTNEQNRTNSMQASNLAAAQGARGLRATLAAIGALGGTGELLANRAVAQSANQDIGAAKNAFDTNATALSGTYEDVKAADERRKLDAASELVNANTKSRGENASSGQDLYAKIAALYGDVKDTGNAKTYVDKGIALQPDVTAASKVQSPSYDTGKLAFTPAALAKYLGGQNDMSVNVAGGNNLPTNTIFTNTKKRDQELA